TPRHDAGAGVIRSFMAYCSPIAIRFTSPDCSSQTIPAQLVLRLRPGSATTAGRYATDTLSGSGTALSAETGKLRTAELMPHPVRGPGADFRVAVAAADYAFAAFIILISADAFMFLGVHSFLWLAAYGYIALRILLSFRRFLDFLLRNLVYLGFPALALVSTIWSDLPAETVRLSLQIIVTTLIALFIGMRLAPREILWITGAVLLVLMAASMANIGGAIGPAYNEIGRAHV